MLIAAATIFMAGAGLFIWNFFRYAPRFDVVESPPRGTTVEITEVRITT